jgi:hypothetical protein
MSQIPASFVRNIYVMCIKYTFNYTTWIWQLRKTEKNCRGTNVARNITAFCSLVMFLVDGLTVLTSENRRQQNLTIQIWTLSCRTPLHSIQHKKHVAPIYSNANTGKCRGLQNNLGSKIWLTPSFIQIYTFLFASHFGNHGNNSSYRNLHNIGNKMDTVITITTVTIAVTETFITSVTRWIQ